MSEWEKKGLSMASKVGCLIVVLVIILNLFIGLLTIVPPSQSQYTLHDTILIEGDADFIDQANNESWPGGGSLEDPFIIEEFEIIAEEENGIEIRHTTFSFILRNLLIRDGEDHHNRGIYLYNVTNVLIENCEISNNRGGITISYSQNISINDNLISFNEGDGIQIFQSIGIDMTSNTLLHNGIDIWGYELEHWSSHNIDFSNMIDTKPICYLKDQIGGQIQQNSGQIILVNCSSMLIEDQGFGQFSFCIDLAFSSNNTIINNSLSNDAEGMSLYYSNNNEIKNNSLRSLYLYGSDENEIDNNYLYSGIWCYASDNNTFISNTAFSGGGFNYFWNSNGNNIVDNYFSSSKYGWDTYLGDSNHNIIRNNSFGTLTLNISGSCSIHSVYSHGNNVTANHFFCDSTGFYFDYSEGEYLDGNNVSSGEYFIYLQDSRNITLRNTTIKQGGIILLGSEVVHWNSHNIDESNLIKGKPICYVKDKIGGNITSCDGPLILANCSNVTIKDNEITGMMVGIQMGFCSELSVVNNTIAGNGAGVYIENSFGNMIMNNTAVNNLYGIHIKSPFENTIQGNNVSHNIYGIYIDGSYENEISGNTAYNNDYGIFLMSSDRMNITNNTVFSNARDGISLFSSERNNISENTVYSNIVNGIYVYSSGNNTISDNSLSGNEHGVGIQSSRDNTITSNNAFDNRDGIYLCNSEENNIIANTASTNERGIYVFHASRNNVESNFLNENNHSGICIYHSMNNNIAHNNASNNRHGICLERHSRHNLIEDNTVYSNTDSGIYIHLSERNNISRNHIIDNFHGMCFDHSCVNLVTNNIITSNREDGLNLIGSSNNIFHHNNIIDNSNQLNRSQSTNFWHNGTGSGNYWSDYQGKDKDSDGVGDTDLPHNDVDEYPLMEQADITEDYGTHVDIDYQKVLEDKNGSKALRTLLGGLILLLIVVVIFLILQRRKKKSEEQEKEKAEKEKKKEPEEERKEKEELEEKERVEPVESIIGQEEKPWEQEKTDNKVTPLPPEQIDDKSE